jgi:hypothetical protein
VEETIDRRIRFYSRVTDDVFYVNYLVTGDTRLNPEFTTVLSNQVDRGVNVTLRHKMTFFRIARIHFLFGNFRPVSLAAV